MNRVLIVDDKEENAFFLRSMLQGYGFDVDAARNGAEALVRARQAPPGLIISDLLMPVMDGYTLLRHWKADERLKTIPFIVYTATYTDPRDERLALDLGADAFILKPLEPEPFMARIREVLERAQRGELSPPLEPTGEEKHLLKEYNEVLVHKLEEKALRLEAANRALQQDIDERKQVEAKILEQQETIRKLSTPVLEASKGLLIVPLIGSMDAQRARQVTDQVLKSVRANRAKAVVIDITGVATMNAAVANHLVQTAQAARLLGARVIVTGMSRDVALTVVTLGVDLAGVQTAGDLRSGIEEGHRLLGYELKAVDKVGHAVSKSASPSYHKEEATR